MPHIQDLLTNDAHTSLRVTFKLINEDEQALQSTSKAMGISQKEFFAYAVTRYCELSASEIITSSKFDLAAAQSKTLVVPKLLMNYLNNFEIHRDIILSGLINKQKEDDITSKLDQLDEFITYVNAAFQNSDKIFDLIEDEELREKFKAKIDGYLNSVYLFGEDLLETIKTGKSFNENIDKY